MNRSEILTDFQHWQLISLISRREFCLNLQQEIVQKLVELWREPMETQLADGIGVHIVMATSKANPDHVIADRDFEIPIPWIAGSHFSAFDEAFKQLGKHCWEMHARQGVDHKGEVVIKVTAMWGRPKSPPPLPLIDDVKDLGRS